MQSMKRVRITIIMVLLVLIPAAGITYLLAVPRLTAVSPQANAEDIAALSPLQLEFSRRMDADSVTERLHIQPAPRGEIAWDTSGRVLTITPTEPWPSGETIQVRLETAANASGFLPLTIRQEASWSFTIGQPNLVYLSPSDGPPNLYLLNPFDGNIRQLTNHQEGVTDFDVDSHGTLAYYSVEVPDGSMLYAIEDLASPADQEVAIPEPVLALNCQQAHCSSPRLAPDKSYLAYERTAFTSPGEH
ncbi:MAG TPA: Ig-like domain-containing protein, partial [Anaerolineales bacterium]|nr:Ig-like domain-containing protein [Anaerolineales bacterium]